MSVLINLLPDIRLQKQRDKQRRQMVTAIALLVMVVCGGFVVLMLIITSGQSILIKNGRTSIENKKATLTNTPGLMPALSAQARLNSIATLYTQRTLMTKLLGALNEVSPSNMQITALKFSATDSTLAIAGNVQSYADAAKLTQALKAAHVTIGTGSPTDKPYFTNVSLQSESRGAGEPVDFSLSATIAPGATNGN